MSTILISQIGRCLSSLKKLCGRRGKKELVEQIEDASSHLSETSDINFDVLLKPFFTSLSIDIKKYHAVSLMTFVSIFMYTNDQYLLREIITKIIQSVLLISEHFQVLNDESCLQCMKVISYALQSQFSDFYIHGKLLKDCFNFFLKFYDAANERNTIQEVAEMTVLQLVRKKLESYNKEIDYTIFQSDEKIAEFIPQYIIDNAIIINKFAPGKRNVTIQDIDLYVLSELFSNALEDHTYNVKTLSVCSNALALLIGSDSSFFKKDIFISLLKTQIFVALLTLALDNHQELEEGTAKLIKLVWKKYSFTYLAELNEILDKGISIALNSPYDEIVQRTLRIFSKIVEDPQFLVDAFVNCDCDQSGYFRNIYENCIQSIVRNSYPNENGHKTALQTLINVLNSLWEYFQKNHNKSVEEENKNNTNEFIEAKKAKNIFDQGLDLFKKSPMKGITFFIQHNIIKNNDPATIASFLFNTPLLDPVAIGEVIGGAKELNLQILPQFINLFDFKGMNFEAAFREFLSKFHIPGEAQMIDRIMEQFGSKFYNDNPNLFSSADTVYVLAFATLMLHTDAHHPNVKQKMTLNEFIANNRGIDGGKDLPFEFLEQLYKGITSEKINLTSSSTPSLSLMSRKAQIDLYKQQCEQTLSAARERTTSGSLKYQYHKAESSLLIGVMFQSIWRGILAVLTMSFETESDIKMINLCLEGFKLCTHIASHCYIEDALNTLIDSFAKFTRLQAYSTTLESKNFLCTNALFHCAIEDIEYLKFEAWLIVLGQISALDKMKDNESFVCDLGITDQIFSNTSKLSRESILDFVNAMCIVSSSELNETPARKYMLLKFSDIAFYNMNRPMFIWKDIWNIISDFLIKVGCSQDKLISVTAVDIIRQLSNKFLPRKEITQFHFQEHFLQPFNYIYEKQSNLYIKEVILDCVEMILTQFATVLHSGWLVFFRILNFASFQTDENELKKKAFNILKITLDLIDSAKNYRLFLMNILSSFLLHDYTNELSSKAIKYFSIIANSISPEETEEWICLFQNLGKSITFGEYQVLAEDELISIMINNGCSKNKFSDDVWHFFFGNFLNDIISLKDDSNSEHWRIFQQKLFDELIKPFTAVLINSSEIILKFLAYCSKSENNYLENQSLEYLKIFVIKNKDYFQQHEEQLFETLNELAAVLTSPYLIEILNEFFEIFSKQNVVKVFHIIFENCITRIDDKSIYEFWCKAQQSYLKYLVSSNLVEDVAQFIKSIFENSLKIHNSKYWNELLLFSLQTMSNMDQKSFEKCKNESISIVCQMIEFDDTNVRKELIEVMKRCFNQQ